MSTYIQIPASLGSVDSDNISAFTSKSCRVNCGETDGCEKHCASKCNRQLNESETASDNLCCHWNTNGNKTWCCLSDCGITENMASCAVVVKDKCNKDLSNCGTGGQFVCTRSCADNCPNFEDIKSKTNFIQNQTVFQPDQDCKTNDCKGPNCSILAYVFRPWQNCIYDVKDFENATTS